MLAQAPPRLPRIEPIVPTAHRLPFNDPAWLFESKYDGFRGMLYLTRSSCTLYSKRGNAMRRFQDLADQVGHELGRREVILDGEIVALDDEGRISFWDLMRGRGTLPAGRRGGLFLVYFRPTTEHRYTSSVSTRVISGLGPAAAASISSSETNW
jgi:hypothetical protein